MKAYKVIENFNHGYNSSGSGLTLKDTLFLHYTPGQIIIAPQGTVGIFIFKSYTAARWYGSAFSIVEVETLAQVKPVTKVINDLTLLEGPLFDATRYKENLIPVGEQYYEVPDNSFLCRKIKVIGLAKER